MSKTYLPYEPDQQLLLPAALQEWLADDHLAYFMSDVVDQLDMSEVTARYERERRGGPPYHPRMMVKPGFPILGVFRLKGQPKRDGSIIVRSCKASQSPVNPIRDAILAVNHVSCPSLSSSGPRQWGESVLKTSRLPGALSLLTRSWLHSPSAWGRR